MITLIITVALIGLITWLVTYFIPMPPKFQTLIYVIAAVCVVLYVLSALGVYHLPLGDVPRR